VIESEANPAPSSHVRWSEEPVGLAGDKLRLRTGGSGAPQMWEVIIMVAIQPEHQELLAGKEGRSPVARSLRRSGQSQADGADTVFQLGRAHQGNVSGHHLYPG